MTLVTAPQQKKIENKFYFFASTFENRKADVVLLQRQTMEKNSALVKEKKFLS